MGLNGCTCGSKEGLKRYGRASMGSGGRSCRLREKRRSLDFLDDHRTVVWFKMFKPKARKQQTVEPNLGQVDRPHHRPQHETWNNFKIL